MNIPPLPPPPHAQTRTQNGPGTHTRTGKGMSKTTNSLFQLCRMYQPFRISKNDKLHWQSKRIDHVDISITRSEIS